MRLENSMFDPGLNIEFSGLVGFFYPTLDNSVISYDKGGVGAQIWYLADGQWISMPQLSTWTPSAPTFVDVQDVAFGKGQALCLVADMWEEDSSTGEGSADDHFGTTAQLILYEDGWAGEHTLHMTGDATNAVDVTVKLTLK
jgi:hypothetical protein